MPSCLEKSLALLRLDQLARYSLVLFVIAAVCLAVYAHDDDDHDHDHDHDADNDDSEDYTKVTYASAVKLVHKTSGYRLHSSQIKYGSGSGQQCVTGFEHADSPDSLWQIKDGFALQDQKFSAPGTVVACNDVIRLQHASTKKWLHSHLHSSPLTHRQEISGYGEENGSGAGSNADDNWKVECSDGRTEWKRETPVSFVHVGTGKRLFTRKQDIFDNNNCRGCPIVGQLELSAHQTSLNDPNALWMAEDGVYFPAVQNSN